MTTTEQQDEFQDLLESSQFAEAKEMATTFFEQGVEKGRELGEIEGRRAILAAVLEARFGALTPEAPKRIEALTVDELQELAKRAVRASSLAELGLDS